MLVLTHARVNLGLINFVEVGYHFALHEWIVDLRPPWLYHSWHFIDIRSCCHSKLFPITLQSPKDYSTGCDRGWLRSSGATVVVHMHTYSKTWYQNIKIESKGSWNARSCNHCWINNKYRKFRGLCPQRLSDLTVRQITTGCIVYVSILLPVWNYIAARKSPYTQLSIINDYTGYQVWVMKNYFRLYSRCANV